MNLANLVYKRLAEDPGIAGSLAEFDHAPAVFETEFPNDQADGWGGRTQYPRISYQFDMQVDTDRKSSGTLHVSVYTEKNPLAAERLEIFVRQALKDVLMKPDGQAPVCVAWARTDPYMIEGNGILCKDIVFDILEYPDQETTDPDPVAALSLCIKGLFPECTVLGVDKVGVFTNPADAPVFYCRLESMQLDTSGYLQGQVTWFNAVIAVHLLCPDPAERLKIIAGLNQQLANDGEVTMLDDSPMTIRGITVNNRADYLRGGQLTVNAHYGCLKDSFEIPKVMHVNGNIKQA